MVKIQFSVKNAFVQKYTLFLTVVCLVMTLMNTMNRIHYIGASYAIGAILMGITNHIHNSLSITGIGCVLDMLHLIFHSSNSSSASVRYFQFIIHFLAIVYELMYMTMLHCYWQYTEAIKNLPQTSLLEKQTISPIELGKFNQAAQNPSIGISQPIQVTGPDAAIAPIEQNSISESPEPIEVTEPSKSLTGLNITAPEPNSVSDPSTATEMSEAVLKPTLSSTETSLRPLNTIVETLRPIETTEPSANVTELGNTLTDLITTSQEPNSAALDSFVETQNSIAEIESRPVFELDENSPNDNLILTEPSERLQEYSVSIPEPKEEKQ